MFGKEVQNMASEGHELETALRRYRRLHRLGRAIIWLLLVIGSALMMVPFLWLVSSSLKSPAQLWVFPPQWIPNPVKWSNYREALTTLPFHIYFKNTILIVTFTLFGVLGSSSLSAYGFARLRFPGRDAIFMILLSTMMLPGVVLMIPQFVMFRNLGWIDTFKPLIIPHYFGGGAFNVFLLRQFFRSLPEELSDAARIDGCGEFKIYYRIILPLAKPALATIGIFTFMGTWNDFMGPLIYLNSPEKRTLALGLASFRSLYATHWNLLMAASTVMVIPIIVLFFGAQRHFVQGIVLTGLKG